MTTQIAPSTQQITGALVHLRGLSVAYPQFANDTNEHDANERAPSELALALKDFDLTCPPGTATLLTGPSGSGKSTVLRALNGLVTHLDHAHCEGEGSIGDLNIFQTGLTTIGRTVGIVFQHPRRQFFTATVVEELAFSLCNAGDPPESIKRAVADVAELIGIVDLLASKVTELSGGQLQRVALAVALVSKPRVLLLDEPTSNSDADDIQHLAQVLTELKAAGTTLIIADHRVNYLREVVDQVAVLRNGSLDTLWETEEFYGQSDDVRRAAGLRQLTPTPALSDDETHEPATPESETGFGVDLNSVQFSYGSNPVLNIANLCIPAGKITALMGPCGAGKSTLANVICGLSSPQKGTLRFNGTKRSAKERIARSALVMQDVHRQLFAVSTREEIITGSRLSEQADPDALLEALDLTEFAERHPMSLSGGQKQRVVIGAALATQAEVYIFDEPTSGVDYKHLQQIAGLLKNLADQGAVVIVVTHDQELVSECADKIIQLGPPEPDGGPSKLVLQSPS